MSYTCSSFCNHIEIKYLDISMTDRAFLADVLSHQSEFDQTVLLLNGLPNLSFVLDKGDLCQTEKKL